jgi:hypothetical protein
LDSYIGSDPKVVFAFWLGVGVMLVTLIMLGVILVMRQVILHRQRQHARAVARWRGILTAAAGTEAGGVPVLREPELSGFLEVWNELHEPLHGATTPYFSSVARLAGLEPQLHRILDRGSFHHRLVTIIALGHVKNATSFGRVAAYIDDRSPIVSLCAARALMQLDSARAVSLFVPRIVRRSDWSQGSIAVILKESEDTGISQELADVTLRATAEIAPRLIRFLASVDAEAAAPIIRKSLTASSDERMISTCLQVLSTPALLDCVRPLLRHPRWHVRMQAAVTLGRLGVPGDDGLLVPLLSDPQWWVRYRTAQALLKLPFIGRAGLKTLQPAQGDAFARDIIDHVLAEALQAAPVEARQEAAA